MKKLLILVLFAIIACSDINPSEENNGNEGSNNYIGPPKWVITEYNSNDYTPRLTHWIKKKNMYGSIVKCFLKNDLECCSKLLAINPCYHFYESLKKNPNFK